MKFNDKEIPPVFTPVEITITFESQEELEMIHEIMKRNVTVPDLIYQRSSVRYVRLQNVMADFSSAVFKHTWRK
jgi:hypothetical protein